MALYSIHRDELDKLLESPYLRAKLRQMRYLCWHHTYQPRQNAFMMSLLGLTGSGSWLSAFRLNDYISPDGQYKHAFDSIDTYHRLVRGWKNGLGYYFGIEGDGVIRFGKRWTNQLVGAHCKEDSMNVISVGIALLGDFGGDKKEKDKWEKPTLAQVKSALALGAFLCELYNIKPIADNMHYHHDHAPYKSCPGYTIIERPEIRSLLTLGIKNTMVGRSLDKNAKKLHELLSNA